MIRLIGMVVAVVDEVIRDGVAMGCVEALQQGLRNLFLMYLNLLDKAVGLLGTEGTEVIALHIHMTHVTELIELILTDGRLILLPVGDVKGLIDHVGVNPCLRGLRNSWVMGSNSGVTAMDVGVGKPRPRNPNGGAAPCRPNGVVRSTRANAQGGAALPKVPTNSGEDFYRTPKTKKTHTVNYSQG